jgi:predicted dehydrogenase
VAEAELVAVGSRSEETAVSFATQYNIPNIHTSYEALVNDPDVDVIYIGTPHVFHKENTLMCLEAGKHVLCEKPFALNAQDAQEMAQMAQAKGLFLMEAMWTRFLPIMGKVRTLLAEGVIGDIRMIAADFGFRAGFDPTQRLFNPELGGGALLDVGIYPISFAFELMGAPNEIISQADIGASGVDEQSTYLFKWNGGQLAQLSSAVRTETVQEAVIYGTNGRIHLHSPWWRGEHLTLVRDGKQEKISVPMVGNGYNYEATAVSQAIRAGQTEHPLMPLSETIAIMQTMDTIRQQWGLVYPQETAM